MDGESVLQLIADNAPTESDAETQLGTIRDLMLTAASRGEWLTLSEVAGLTEFGEASISAQLRHLRKPHFGRYRVEKRVRRSAPITEDGCQGAIWEYRVLKPFYKGQHGRTPSSSDGSEAETSAAPSADAQHFGDHDAKARN